MNMHVCPDCLQICFCDCVDREFDCMHYRDCEEDCEDESGRSDSELRIIGSRDYDDQEYELGEAGA